MMINPRNIVLPCALFICLAMTACVTAEKESVSRELSVRQQSERTIDALGEIARMLEGSDSKKILPRVEAAYLDIIRKYPESPLVHECYRKLMAIYLADYDPPEQAKAEQLYDEFLRRYPDSDERHSLADILGEIYYRNAQWKRLTELYSPDIRSFIAHRELRSPGGMLMYAEAKFHLGEMDEARKGYNIVIFYFPHSVESALARKRLDEIAGGQPGTPVTAENKPPSNSADAIERQPQSMPPEPVPAEGPVPGDNAAAGPPPAPDTREKGIYSIQAGFFENEANANALSEKLKNKGYDAFVQEHMSENKKTFFRVLVGRYHDKSEAVEQAGTLLHREGLKSIGVGLLDEPLPGAPAPKEAASPDQPAALDTIEQSFYSVQVGFFGREKNAAALSEKLKKKGYDAFVQKYVNKDNKVFFRVLIGRYPDKTEAVEQAGTARRREGLKSLVIRQDGPT